MAQPYPDLFFEDRQIGQTTDIGRHTFTRDDIIGFARQFDPQPFHLDEEAAKASLFGGLCASGWQTAALLDPRRRHDAAGRPTRRRVRAALRWRRTDRRQVSAICAG